jgi:hypothetical protein
MAGKNKGQMTVEEAGRKGGQQGSGNTNAGRKGGQSKRNNNKSQSQQSQRGGSNSRGE